MAEKTQTSKSKVAAFTEIYVWGNDEYGQLGLGHRYQKSTQKQQIQSKEDDKIYKQKASSQQAPPPSAPPADPKNSAFTNDFLDDDEFVVRERLDLSPSRVEIIFNRGFNPLAHDIKWKYTAMNDGVTSEMLKRGDSIDQSLFGWSQYTNNCYDNYQGMHQILVRMPLVLRDLIINEEGKVTLEENESWTLWTPYIRDFDVLVVPAAVSPNGEEMRFEIVNKRDSVIQGTLVSQRFKLKYLEASDARYDVPILTDPVTVEPLSTVSDETLWRYIACDLIYDPDYKTYVHTEHNS